MRYVPKPMVKIALGCLLVGVGYVLGSTPILRPAGLLAQDEKAEKTPAIPGLTEETVNIIKEAAAKLEEARKRLETENRWNTATQGMNAFAILSGGNDSINDLENGRGVDPETFAALYAGLAVEGLQEKVGRDPEGNMTFNGKKIRMLPISRLKNLYGIRATVTQEDLPGLGLKPAAPKPEATE